MRVLLSFACLFWFGILAAQGHMNSSSSSRFSEIDSRARSLRLQGNHIIQLTDSLTAPYPTELEKARAIFAWLGAHIAYDCGSENSLEQEPDEPVHPLYYTQQQLENILKTRRTRCDGYAFLFELMCSLEGIYCTRQEGYLRVGGKTVNAATVLPNHAWNAAKLDGQWYEIDPTAGAGQCDERRFRPMLNDAYFGMSDQLIKQKYIPIEDGRRLQNQGRINLKH